MSDNENDNKKFSVTFEPKEDITAFELAKCLKFYALILGNNHMKASTYEYWFKQLPPEIIRHFDGHYND